MDGILLLNKGAGVTSFHALTDAKRALGTKHLGHTGTLDLFADGLLVVMAGRLTHLVGVVTGFDKTYRALVRFGEETDTLDPEGAVVKTAPLPSEEAVRAALPSFTGPIMQAPPMYSALHVNGKRASDLARSGSLASDLPPRPVTIYSLKMSAFTGDTCVLDVRCSKGAYIRSLARDIARSAGSVGRLERLRRLTVGPFSLEDAVPADAPPEQLRASLRPFTPELARICGLVPVALAPSAVDDFHHGRPLRSSWFTLLGAAPASSDDAKYAVFGQGGEFHGVISTSKDGRLKSALVL
jgi:tRNA pseudouridine55 synthase